MSTIDYLVREIMSGMDCVHPQKFEKHIRIVLEQATLGSRLHPCQKVVGVFLPAADWQEIATNLYLDAYVEDDAEDDQLPCHSNRRATERCANVIDQALREIGWTSALRPTGRKQNLRPYLLE